ncbi:class I SAM-dependent methyltransferase [Candidatus Gottesmanbacteria bacterium]|nr:class I SAM-dependent methyltransferase [Candidatus Gottesmanbacteria bacterium]
MTNKNRCVICEGTIFQFLFSHHHGWSVQKCKTCEMVQVMPRPSAMEVSALYANDDRHFDPYREQIAVHRAYFHTKIAEIVASWQSDAVLHRKRRRLLDVGCAMGVLLEEAKKSGFIAEGIDMSKASVKTCVKKGFRVVHGSLTTLSLNKKYDVVTAFEVIEHELNPRKMMESIHTHLSAGGVVIVTTPGHESWYRKLMGRQWVGYTHPEHLNFFDEETLKHLMHEVGFHNVFVKKDIARPFPLSFAFRRASDYFPAFRFVLEPLSIIAKHFDIQNPINPWGCIEVIAVK